jgi:hypothetical protein
MSRNRAYWKAKLKNALAAEKALVELTQKDFSSQPELHERVGLFKWGSRQFKRMLLDWERDQRARRRYRRRLAMLRETKIPYYEARIRDLTPTALDRVLGEPFV